MFKRNSKQVPLPISLEVVNRLLKSAQESKEDPPHIQLVFCRLANELLSEVKKKAGNPNGPFKSENDRRFRELIANAYLDLAVLTADLQDSKTTERSRAKAKDLA